MSTQVTSLLEQYNKLDPYRRSQPIDTRADETNGKFFTPSYANMYDALYNKFSTYKNFNMDMWQHALEIGEQDQYLALLEQNKDAQLSPQFYDSQYYDYESMMMELYLPIADDTKLEKYTQDVFDNATGKWVTEDLGEMTQRQYYQYLLNNIRAAKDAELTRQLEQEHKDQKGFWGQLGADAMATFYEFGEGLLSALTGVVDIFGGLGYASYAGLAEGDNWFDAFVEYYGEKGLTAAEKNAIRMALDDYERRYTHFRDIDGNMTGVGNYLAGISNSIGMMAPAIVLSLVPGGASLATATFYISIFSNNVYENAANPELGGPSWVKITDAALKTGAELAIEYTLGKVLGGTIQNKMIGLDGPLRKGFIKNFTKTSGLKYFFKSAAQEGLEEFLQDFGTNCIDQFVGLWHEGYANTGVTFQTLIDSFIIGALSSMVMSGGHIGLSALASSVRNAKMPGSGDLIIETEKGTQKVKGFNRLYYSQILSDFKKAVDELKNGKIRVDKNIGLAQEVYGAFSAISQFYSSIGEERMKNCELLLDRVVKAEQGAFTQEYSRAATILSPETMGQIIESDKDVQKTIKSPTKTIAREQAQTLGHTIERIFRSMVGGAQLRHAEKLRAAADEKEEALRENGVTTATAAVDKDGIKYSRDPDILALEERIGKKGMDTLDELRKGYEWVIATDGHIICESGEYVFVSESWLKNYKYSDLVRYLEQTRVLEALRFNKEFAPMTRKLIAFDEEFTGQKGVTAERALMDFMFNPSVYQGFLLSNAGKNMHEYKNFIFQFHNIIKDLAERSKYHQQKFKGKQSQLRVNMLNQIYEQIKKTMRKPTIIAILNWGMEPQDIGADDVLTPEDRQTVNKYKNWRRMLSDTGANRSAYENLVEDIIANAQFNDDELALVRKSLNGTATLDEEIEARALLEEADRRMTRYDFEVSPEYSYYLVSAGKIVARLKSVDFTKISESYSDEKRQIISSLVKDINWYVQEAIDDAPSYMDSRNLGTEAGVVERAAERIRETLEEYNYDISKNSDINSLVDHLGSDGSLEMLKEDVAELTRLLKASLDTTGKTPYDVAMTQLTEIIDDIKTLVNEIRDRPMPDKLSDRISFWYERSFESDLINRGAGVDLNLIAMSGVQLIRDYCAHVEKITMKHRKKVGLGAFTVPYHVASLIETGDMAGAQFVTDKLDEFESIYGISARQMITGDLSGMSMVQRNQLTQDMETLNAESIVTFVIEKLEGMLGGKYIVTPTDMQLKPYALRRGKAASVYNNTHIYNFIIAKAIPAETLLSHDILAEDIETRNAIFKQMFPTISKRDFVEQIYDELREYNSHYDELADFMKERFSREEIEYMYEQMEILFLRVESGEDSDVVYGEFIDLIARGVNPFTGESFSESESEAVTNPIEALFAGVTDVTEVKDPIFAEVFHFDLARRSTSNFVPLSDIINVSDLPIMLDDVKIYFKDAGENTAGYTDFNVIVVDPHKSSNYFGTLIHEINHILQARMGMPGGFNDEAANRMPDFLTYIVNHYPNYIKYTLGRAGYGDDIEIIYGEDGDARVTKKFFLEMPTQIRNIIAYCGYMLVQGELWARAYAHNGKPVHGFAPIFTERGDYLLAPDGKTKFKIIHDTSDAKSMSKTSVSPRPTEVVAGSALDVAIQKLFLLKARQENGEAVSRDTYHTRLTRESSSNLVRAILNPAVPLHMRYSIRLGDIIREPQDYLAPEILAKCNGDFSEGNVFYRLKEYVEANFEGISLDINDRQEYIWVDDNAFDDTLLPSVQAKKNSEETSLVRQYGTGEHIPLTAFYSSKELARLGINPTAYVVVAPNVKTEAVFDHEHLSGAIFIKSNERMTDATFIDKLNHEFRHLLQIYNGFATGFTPDFKVSREMLEDVKKHVPGLFENAAIVRWAKAYAGTKWEEHLVQRFFYYTSSGELNAYAFNASELYSKPTFVNKEAGNPTIFAPWYDAKTGKGRYQTEYLAMRAEDTPKKKYMMLPQADKKPKHVEKKVEKLDDAEKITYVYKKRRSFTLAKAKGTNLVYFVKKGQRNQMDPDLQEFIIATTGHEDELPPEVMHAIKKGILTKQALFKWFRKADTINEFTFDLMNKYFFKNDHITSMAELDKLLVLDPSFYWAAAKVLLQEDLSLESFGIENDVNSLVAFVNDLKSTKWKTKIEKMQTNFDVQWIRDSKGERHLENIGYDERVQRYMRVFAMTYFNGTLAGAFYMANVFRKVARKYEEEVRGGASSIDVSHGNQKGDKELTKRDILTEDDQLVTDDSVANDIIAVYERDTNVSFDDMIEELALNYYNHLAKKAGINPDEASTSQLLPLAQKVFAYREKLASRSLEEVTSRYTNLKSAQLTDTQASDTTYNADVDVYKNSRESIARRIKGRANTILKYIREGEIRFKDLPDEVQAMFQLTDATTDRGKKTEVYELKPDTYKVGRGRAKLPGETSTGRFNYAGKHDITEGNEAFRHDTTQILANLEKLVRTVKAIRALKNAHKKGKSDLAKITTKGEKTAKLLSDIIRSASVSKDKQRKQTEIRVTKKKKRTSDVPNVFNISSAIDMPQVLYKILDTSFEDMADTLVQFASRDEKTGQLYDKKQFKPEDFESRVQHEVSNWDAFYEANRNTLLSLSRNDVLDIIEFFQRGAHTIDGPMNKFVAFEIFLIGYIVDASRRNTFNWDFSQAEIKMIGELYEAKASAHGSGLQAVQQMLKVVDPMKKVRQRMFDDWTEISDDDKDALIDAVDDLQAETDTDRRIEKAKAITEMLESFGKRQAEASKDQYPRWSKEWWARQGSKAKSFRYLSMLSGPGTWVRNILSNVFLAGLNKASDAVGGIIFSKKGYRKDQWNLNGVKIDNASKTFIDTYILNNPIFDPLYNLSSKYDARRKKEIADEKGLLVSLIAKAYEREYAARHRFDSGAMNAISKFIDKRISDTYFVKLAVRKYFGKMLTIEVARGNIDLSQGLSNDVLNLFAESVILANTEYMHKRSPMADILDGTRDKHPRLYEALTFWQPFMDSSFNWFAEYLKCTPIGLINSIKNMCTLEARIAKLDARRAKGEMVPDSRVAEFLARRDIGKGIIGLLLSALGVWFALARLIRLDEEDEKMYVYAGDVKFDITSLFGSSSVLMGAAIAQGWIEQPSRADEKNKNMPLEDVLSLATATMLDGFFVVDLLNRHRWNKGPWDALLTETESVMRSFVPQAWQTLIACTNKQKIRYSPGFTGMIERWLNTFVPTQPLGNRKINPYTGEVEDKYSMPIIPGAIFEKGLLGPKIYWVDVSEQERMCRELGVNKGELTGELTVEGKKYELDRFALNEKYGELNKESLSKIKSQKHMVEMPDGKFKTLSWDQMDDKQRANVIKRTMNDNADTAKIYVWTQLMDKKYYASSSTWQELKKLGLTKNVYKGDKGFVE